MIKSMTGYGSAKGAVEGLEISVELKSVNNRYLDTTVKLPRAYVFTEDAVRRRVQQAVSRGKVDVFVTVDASAADAAVASVGEESLAAYVDARALVESVASGDGAFDLVLAANAVRSAAEKLGAAVGATYSADLLDRLFSRFCVGK